MIAFPIKQGIFKYEVMDHHAILGAPLNANSQQIRQCYLKIAYLLHPDTCKAKSDVEKKRAVKLFSRLVNPAYELLSRESNRTEHLLILSQTAKSHLEEKDKITIANPETRALFEAKNNLDLLYHQQLHRLTTNLYLDLERLLPQVAQISELNLVYLFMRAGESPRITPIATSTSTIAPLSPSVSTAQSAPKVQNTQVGQEPSRSEAQKIPPKEMYLRRAQEYYERDNFNQAIAELREVLKIDPKESRAHCLLGLSYLKSNMLTMAKVHINTASELSPNDPTVLMAKRQLDKNTTNPGAKKADDKSSKTTFLGGLFGGKKK